MKINYSIILALLLLVMGCSDNKENITHPDDYNAYLMVTDNEALQTANADRDFWAKKLETTEGQFPYHVKIAGSYSQLFSVTGNIEYLIKSEEHLIKANEMTNYEKASYLRALAHNYISQHRFKEALKLLQEAELNGENLLSTEKMLFDVHMELGNYELAKIYLDNIENQSDFDYLIRVGKWSDHKGNLDAAIKYMEKAMAIAESSNLPSLKKWVYTNLGDFYGHAGMIKESYEQYLQALEIDPSESYAKKGIAWIVYSYEDNSTEALRILNEVSQENQSPDYHLLMAEIAEHMGDEELMLKEMDIYKQEINNSDYGVMYNKYKVLHLSDDSNTTEEAIIIANKEVSERPTPQSYDLLAWAHLKNGNKQKALEIAENYVYEKTYEPEVIYHLAEIFKANGKENMMDPLKQELLGSIYELGPTMEKKIAKL